MIKINRNNIFHIISILITAFFIYCSLYHFNYVFIRLITTFKELGNSLGYYFCELFAIEHNINPIVVIIDESSYSLLPFTWEEFKIRLSIFLLRLFDKANIKIYLGVVNNVIKGTLRVIMFLLPVFLGFYILFINSLRVYNNKYNVDSKPLKIFKAFSMIFIRPLFRFINSYINFIKQYRNYLYLWMFIWVLNLNLISIIISMLAYYFYFVVTYNFISIYVFIVKLLIDFNVIIFTVPSWMWLLTGLIIIDILRKKIGYNRLIHMEMKNRGFINSLDIVSMAVGTMGAKKTTTITDMALSQEVMFRDKAFELILENDLKFPNFPWVNLENEIRAAIERREIYNLASCEKYIKRLRNRFELILCCKCLIKYTIKKKSLFPDDYLGLAYNYPDCIFGYDYNRYGLYFDDKLKTIFIYDVIEIYAKLYYIYIFQSSLLFSNYSIREDNLIADVGNFPLWNTDFFRRDSRLIDSYSRHSHILDYDCLRLGKKLVENNQNAGAFEFGVVVMSEIGKERRNQLENKGIKKTDEECNQLNDLFNSWLKMIRHSANIDNYEFIKVFMDEQRPESLGADARELTKIIHIDSCSNKYLCMPFFFIEELLYSFVFSRFMNFYADYRYRRADNTLFLYLMKSIISKIHNYYKGIYNRFSYMVLDMRIEKGVQDKVYNEKNYYLMPKKVYSKRFSTDCFSEIFRERALRSCRGLADIKEYRDVKASIDELVEQKSYFINELINIKENKK